MPTPIESAPFLQSGQVLGSSVGRFHGAITNAQYYYVLEIVILIKTNPYSILLQYRRYVLRRYCAMQIDNNISLLTLLGVLVLQLQVFSTDIRDDNNDFSLLKDILLSICIAQYLRST
jgi:hypothetical protein